ncbi:TerC family protein [Lacipirellula limnantheis]|uniref:Integral membrane protein TerC family protein n=1 Tax=Lacipirellula limnantheis TaxID=2528024 RepID=A0A517U120_9BACT|nr:TerC family protein [Lacipirellula limnantheis]QDT74310.1 Integral membrane protein TerC family protein [Lacipirellula limnantheis]
MEELFTVNSMAALATLSVLEIVLGIDNVVFLAILTGKLPAHQQPKARTLGLLLAAVGRIALLFAISWVITLDKTVLFDLPFHIPGSHPVVAEIEPGEEQAEVTPVKTNDPTKVDSPAVVEALEEGGTPITAKDLVLILGGLFLLGKSTWEIGHQLEPHHAEGGAKVYSSLTAVLAQIIAIDLVFSLDSVLTAVGMVQPDDYEHRWVALAIMISAVVLAIAVMIAFSGPIANFVNKHPSIKMLALSFLILIGVVLVAEGLHTHIPRGYIYFSMAFSLLVEMLNLRARRHVAEERETLEAI